MTYDPQRAAIIQARLDLARELDNNANISFLERAQLRLTLLNTVDEFERGRSDADATEAALRELASHVMQVGASA